MNACDQSFCDFLAMQEVGVDRLAGLVVGYSGGLDSTVLLHLAQRYAGQRTRAIHINHGYNPAAAEWQTHCERVCRDLGVRLQSFSLAPAEGNFSEGQARAERYQRFSNSLADDEVLLLAHHRDDAAETLLLHLFQGRGSYAMPAMRPLGAARLWRPLLALGREDLHRYAVNHKLRWLEDPSNDDRRHHRNYLRHEIMPRLNERFQSLPQRLLQASAHHQALENLLTQILDLNQDTLPLEVFTPLPMAEQLTIVRLWLRCHHHSQPPTRSLTSFVGQLASAEADRQPELRWEGWQLRRFAEQLWCIRLITPRLDRLRISAPGEWRLPQGRLRVGSRDGEALPTGELTVHFWQAPDFECEATIRTGNHRRSIKEALRAAGVPPWRRCGYPVIADRFGVLCVPGVARRDEAVRGEAGISIDWRPDD